MYFPLFLNRIKLCKSNICKNAPKCLLEALPTTSERYFMSFFVVHHWFYTSFSYVWDTRTFPGWRVRSKPSHYLKTQVLCRELGEEIAAEDLAGRVLRDKTTLRT